MTRKSPDTSRERTAVMAGSFDPFTRGHMSVLRRGLDIFDRIIVMIGHNAFKPAEAARAAQRYDEIVTLLSPLANRVEVRLCTGLVAVAAREAGACALLRGVRSVADYEYERNMADVNRTIAGIETILLFAEPELAAISSSVVRELSSYGMDVSQFLPDSQAITPDSVVSSDVKKH